MGDDIVTSLREMATDRARYATHYDGCVERHLECAALRACDEIERLRAAGDALVVAHADDLCDCYQPECVAIRAAHDTWQEACRG